MDSLFQISARILESGLHTLDQTLKGVQSAVEVLSGQEHAPELVAAPVDGPRHIDLATSDLANRLARVMRFSHWNHPEPGAVARDVATAIGRSFGNFNLRDPRNTLFPLHLALSLGTLSIQQALRLFAAAQVVRPSEYGRFMLDFFESFTDSPVFISLEYGELIKRYEARLALDVQDDVTRVELGRTLNKCGFYEAATENLLQAANNPTLRSLALHEAAVALYRSGKFEEAAKAASDALSASIGNDRARIWLWLTAQKLGGYPDFVPAIHRMTVRAGHAPATVEFEDIAAKAGLDKTSAGRGTAVFDFDNDGFLDVAIAAAHGGCNLYHNNGDGTFTDVSIESGLDQCVNGFIIAVGDYNNDGFPDLYINRLGFFAGEGQLFRNNQNGTFTDVTAEAGIKVWGPAFSSAWADYDCDGWLDLFVANNLGGIFDRKTPNRLFRNNRDGTFTEVAEAAGISTPWPTIGAAWGDYNNDGFPDLFLSNALGRSQLYRNNGDGTFTDVSVEAGITEYCIGSTTTWCDYNNDGLLDILQFTWSNHEDVIHTLRYGEGPAHGRPQRIYHNNGDGTFTLRDRDIGLNGCWGTMSGNVGDFNNDGYLDIVLGNGSPRMDRLEPPTLLQNDGKRFHNVTFAAGLPCTGKGHGANFADLFGNGRLSIILASGGAYPGDLMTTRVFYPKRLPGNYLNVRLKGIKSNCSAIGARLCLKAGGRRQYREVSGGTSFGCLTFEQHFGLGATNEIDELEIRWPSGIIQCFTHLPVNDTVRITEGQTSWERPYQRSR